MAKYNVTNGNQPKNQRNTPNHNQNMPNQSQMANQLSKISESSTSSSSALSGGDEYNFGWKSESPIHSTSASPSEAITGAPEHIGTGKLDTRFSTSTGHTIGRDTTELPENSPSENVGQSYYRNRQSSKKTNTPNSSRNHGSNSDSVKIGRNASTQSGAESSNLSNITKVGRNAYSQSREATTKGHGSVSSYIDENSAANRYGESSPISSKAPSEFHAVEQHESSFVNTANEHSPSAALHKGTSKHYTGNNAGSHLNNNTLELKSKAIDSGFPRSTSKPSATKAPTDIRGIESSLTRYNIDVRGMSVSDINRALSSGYIGSKKISDNADIQKALTELRNLKSQSGNPNPLSQIGNGNLTRGFLNTKTTAAKSGSELTDTLTSNTSRMRYISENGIIKVGKNRGLNDRHVENALKTKISKRWRSRESALVPDKSIKAVDKTLRGKKTASQALLATTGKGVNAGEAFSQGPGVNALKTIKNGALVQNSNSVLSRTLGRTRIGRNIQKVAALPLQAIVNQKNILTRISNLTIGGKISNTLLSGGLSKIFIGGSAFSLPWEIIFFPLIIVILASAIAMNANVGTFLSGNSATDKYFELEDMSDNESFSVQHGINATYEKQVSYEHNLSEFEYSHEGGTYIKYDDEVMVEDSYKEGMPDPNWTLVYDSLLTDIVTKKEQFNELYKHSKERQTVNISEDVDEVDESTKYLGTAVRGDDKDEKITKALAAGESAEPVGSDKWNHDQYVGYNLENYWGPINKNFKYSPNSGITNPEVENLSSAKESDGWVVIRDIEYEPNKVTIDEFGNKKTTEVICPVCKDHIKIRKEGIKVQVNLYGTGGLLGDASGVDFTYGDGSPIAGHWGDYKYPTAGNSKSGIPCEKYNGGYTTCKLLDEDDNDFVAIDTKSEAYKNRSQDLTYYETVYSYFGMQQTQFKSEGPSELHAMSEEERKLTYEGALEDVMVNHESYLKYGLYPKKAQAMEDDNIAVGIASNNNPDKPKHLEDDESQLAKLNYDATTETRAARKRAQLELLETTGKELQQRKYNVTKFYNGINAVSLGMTNNAPECDVFYQYLDEQMLKSVCHKMLSKNDPDAIKCDLCEKSGRETDCFKLKTNMSSTNLNDYNDPYSVRVSSNDGVGIPDVIMKEDAEDKMSAKKQTTYGASGRSKLAVWFKLNTSNIETINPPTDNKIKRPVCNSTGKKWNDGEQQYVYIPYTIFARGTLNVWYEHTGIQDLIYIVNNEDAFSTDMLHLASNHDPKMLNLEKDGKQYDAFAETDMDKIYWYWREKDKKGKGNWEGFWQKGPDPEHPDNDYKASPMSEYQQTALAYYELTPEDWDLVMDGIWFPTEKILDGKLLDGTINLKDKYDYYHSFNNASYEDYADLIANIDDATVKTFIDSALSMLGWTYTMGEKRMSDGYSDCSSLVARAAAAAGLTNLNKVAADQWKTAVDNGVASKNVSLQNLAPGTILYYAYKDSKTGEYNNRYDHVSHTAIYIGNGKVVHASSARGEVTVKNVSSSGLVGVAYWFGK